MSATILNITDRSRTRLSQISSLDNFTTTPDGSIDAAQIVDNPAVSLYCLDHGRIAHHAPAAQLREDTSVIAAYLG